MERIAIEKSRRRRPSAYVRKQSVDYISLFAALKADCSRKQPNVNCKAVNNKALNIIVNLFLLAGAATITGLQAVGDCINIPVITISAIMTFVQGINIIFKFGDQSIFFKYASIRLRQIMRQIDEYMVLSSEIPVNVAAMLLHQLRNDFDEIDLETFKSSVGGTLKYASGGGVELTKKNSEDNVQMVHDAKTVLDAFSENLDEVDEVNEVNIQRYMDHHTATVVRNNTGDIPVIKIEKIEDIADKV